MPRNGAWWLSEETEPWVKIKCEKCGRAGRYATARLLAKFGDIGMPDLLGRLSADCVGQTEFAGRCYAAYADPIAARPQHK